jgi:phosphonate transport system substrate-binding protein
MKDPVRFVTFLAPNMFPVYQFIADYVAEKLDRPTQISVGYSFDQFERHQADVGFICGLPYVNLSRLNPSPVELLAAPVLQGERYQGKPIYFSDVIVHKESPYRSFDDLRGSRWSYNDRDSQSGYGITCYWLVKMGETGGFFGEVIEAGFHQKSIQMVANREVDASAIDSQVLSVELRDHPHLASQLKVIESLGPSTIQPVVVRHDLPGDLKHQIREILLKMRDDSQAKEMLSYGFVSGFVPIVDCDYDDIRQMVSICESAGFLTIK